jgi:DtxR family transcriptional regulator, Mn-dependent transcriptional regulator
LVNPAATLIVFAIFSLLVTIIIIPKVGILALLRRKSRDNKRILIEDSLKYLYDNYLKKQNTSIESLSGVLKLGSNQGIELSQMLVHLNLAELTGNTMFLTDTGRDYAVKVIRIHRLLEKYLAEETSVKEDDWHKVAEDKEHLVPDSEIESLSAKLGNPILDPHGDPIPNRYGEQYQVETRPLSELSENEIAKIVHIEDEPPAVYSKILLFNLHIGTLIKIMGTGRNKILLEADGKEVVLPKELAENIFISKPDSEEINENFTRLSELKANEEAYVAGISKAMRGQQRRRLLDFGFVPGTKISVRLSSIGGDPVAYEIRGTTIALRKQQSNLIFIKVAGAVND